MEEKINIADILKDKPQGTKLYSPLFGDVSLSYVQDGIINLMHHGGTTKFFKNGKYYAYPESEPLLFPSESMRDWSKFAWKKGDVLVSNDYGTEVIFDKWYDDTYTNFYCKHYLNSENKNNIKYNDAFLCATARYSLEDKGAAQTYINTIEKRLGGKLNLETFEIEKNPASFRDGDIVCISGMGYFVLGIAKSVYNLSKKLRYYVLLNDIGTLRFEGWLSLEDKQIYPATEAQQIFLFNVLAKENKAWDAEKKQIVDLKPKWMTLKPFDKVLVRDGKDEIWEPAFFFRNRPELNVYKYQTVGGKLRVYCIPYNEETAKLIGTSDDWEG